MRRLVLAAAASFAAALALPSAARADGVYLSDSLGAGSIGDALADRMSSASMSQTAAIDRVAVGMRVGNWAIEPFYAGSAVDRSTSLTSYGLDVKRLVPVSAHLSVYLRGSVSILSVPDAPPCCVADDGPMRFYADLAGYAGRGLGIGAGAQYSTTLPLLGLRGGVFVEDSYDYYSLFPTTTWEDVDRRSVDASITRLSLGVAVGSDF